MLLKNQERALRHCFRRKWSRHLHTENDALTVSKPINNGADFRRGRYGYCAAVSMMIGMATAGFHMQALSISALGVPSSIDVAKVRTQPSSAQDQAVADGIVERYLLDPRGDVEGLLLTDGVQMYVTSRSYEKLIEAVKPGDHIRVHGIRKNKHLVVQPEVILNMTRNSSFHVPFRLELPLPSKEDRLSMTEMKAGGSIKVFLYGRSGEVRGMVLSDGTQVRFPPDASDDLRNSFRIGDNVDVEGYGTENQYGKAMEITAMGTNGGALVPIDPTIRSLP
jgi:hypothetical protein